MRPKVTGAEIRKRTGQRAAALGEVGGGVLDLADDARGPLQKRRPVLRQRQLARRPVQQTACPRFARARPIAR